MMTDTKNRTLNDTPFRLKKILHKSTSFITEFFTPKESKFYVLLCDGGISLLKLKGRKLNILFEKDIHSIEYQMDCFSEFSNEITKTDKYLGQPVTVLIGGSLCFHTIQSGDFLQTGGLNKIKEWTDNAKLEIGFKYFQNAQNEKNVFVSGIKSEKLTQIIEILKRQEMAVADILPVTLFFLENLLDKPSDITEIELPFESLVSINTKPIQIIEYPSGQTASGLIGGNKAKSDMDTHSFAYYSVFHPEDGSKKNHKKQRSISDLITSSLLNIKSQDIFWLNKNKKGPKQYIATAANGARLASMFTLAVAVILLVSALILSVIAGQFSDTLEEHQLDYQRKLNLQAEIEKRQSALDNLGDFKHAQSSFAGAISAFCQRRPYDLKITEFNIRANNENQWVIFADGIAQKENAIFSYQRFVSDQNNSVKAEVTSIKKMDSRYNRAESNNDARYSFRLRMDLMK